MIIVYVLHRLTIVWVCWTVFDIRMLRVIAVQVRERIWRLQLLCSDMLDKQIARKDMLRPLPHLSWT